MDKETDLS